MARRMRLFAAIFLAAAFCLAAGCNYINDIGKQVEATVNNAAAQDKEMELKLDDIPVGIPSEWLANFPPDVLAQLMEYMNTNEWPDPLPQDLIDQIPAEYQQYVPMIEGVFKGKFCMPSLLNIDNMMKEKGYGWWDDAKGHIQKLEVVGVLYSVKENTSSVDNSLNIYLTSSVDWKQISDAEFFGATANIAIETNTNQTTWPNLSLENNASGRVENLIKKPGTDFAICATVPEIDAGTINVTQITYKFGLKIKAKVTFVPLS